MAQHDYNIANQTFPATRSDINDVLSAVASNNSGTAAPSTTFANQWFYETDTNKLQIRNEDNDAYITIAELDQSNDTIETITSDTLGVGGARSLGLLHIQSGGSASAANSDADEVIIQGVRAGLSFLSNNGEANTIAFGDVSDNDVGKLIYDHSSNAMTFTTNTSERMRIHSSGKVTIGSTTEVKTLAVQQDGGGGAMGIDIHNLGTDSADDTIITYETQGHRNWSHGIDRSASSFVISEADGLGSPKFIIEDGGNIIIGACASAANAILHIEKADSSSGPNSDADELFLENSGNAGITIGSSTSGAGNIHFADVGAANRGILQYDHSSDSMKFGTSGAIEARIDTSGNFIVEKSSAAGSNTVGHELRATGQALFTRASGTVVNIQRNTDDGELVKLQQDGSLEGTISVSGSTVSFNGFTGSHWSRLSDNSKPTILRGTIMDSIDEMCDWYQAVAEVPEILWTDDDPETQDTLWTEDNTLPEGVKVGDVRWASTQTVGDVKEAAYTVKESINLGDKSVGDTITFTHEGTEFTGVILKEDDVKHTKCKVSDTADSKKVYGVFSNWDDADDGLNGDVNDMNIAQVGTYVIRVNSDEFVQAGDLLVSNGDGTAKVQDDDIIRSKTVAKVNSNIKVETYEDGSYTVPCTLHC